MLLDLKKLGISSDLWDCALKCIKSIRWITIQVGWIYTHVYIYIAVWYSSLCFTFRKLGKSLITYILSSHWKQNMTNHQIIDVALLTSHIYFLLITTAPITLNEPLLYEISVDVLWHLINTHQKGASNIYIYIYIYIWKKLWWSAV